MAGHPLEVRACVSSRVKELEKGIKDMISTLQIINIMGLVKKCWYFNTESCSMTHDMEY